VNGWKIKPSINLGMKVEVGVKYGTEIFSVSKKERLILTVSNRKVSQSKIAIPYSKTFYAYKQSRYLGSAPSRIFLLVHFSNNNHDAYRIFDNKNTNFYNPHKLLAFFWPNSNLIVNSEELALGDIFL